MRKIIWAFFAALAVFHANVAHAQPLPTCNVTSVPNFTGTYDSGSMLTLTGRIDLSCDRNGGTKNRSLYIGIGQGNNSRQLSYLSYLLPYQLTQTPGVTSWGSGASSPAVQSLDFTASNTVSISTPINLVVNAGNARPPGTFYTDLISGIVYVDSPTAAQQVATFSFRPTITIVPACSLATLGPLTVAYTSFSPGPVSGTLPVSYSCTPTTFHSFSIAPASGVSAGVNYSLSLSATSASGTGTTQQVNIIATSPAGQAGTCGSATCSGIPQAHTFQIDY